MGALQKIGNFLGINKFGEGIASATRVISGEVNKDIQLQEQAGKNLQKITYAFKNEQNPEKKARLKALLQSTMGETTPTAQEIDPGLNLTNKEILGSAANVGLNILTPGAFKGGKAAILAKNTALGAGFGLASGMEKNRSTKGIVGSTIGGAAVGLAIGGATLMASAAKDFLGKKVPEWMMNKAVKPALQDLKKNVKYGSDTLGKQLLDEGVAGGPQKLLEVAQNKTVALEDQLQSAISQQGLEEARITKDAIVPYLDDLLKQKGGMPGMKGEVQKIKNIVDDIPAEMTLQEANQMKRRIYAEINDVAYKIDARLSTKASILKQIARGLKTEIENAVGGTVVRDINQKLSIYGKLENAMIDQLAREMRNNGVGLTDAILIAGGDTSILSLIRHAGAGVTTNVAQGIRKTVGNLGDQGISKGVGEVMRRTGFNLP